MQRPAKKQKKLHSGNPSIPFSEIEEMPKAQPENRYQMSDDTRHGISISRYLHEHQGDPAIKVLFLFGFIV
jgi:hypothetical protein